MENLAKLLFGETKFTLSDASSSNDDSSNNNVPLSFSDTNISLSSLDIGVPNSSSDAILPPSSSNSRVPSSFSTTIAPPHLPNASPKLQAMKSATVEELTELLYDSESREEAITCLKERSKCTHEACKSKTCQVLAILLWDGFGITNILLQELLAVYHMLSPVKVTPKESNRICNVLALFQVMATHPDVKMGLVRASIPVYVYPFLSAVGDDNPIKFMKLSSLGVIGALVKCEEPIAGVVVHFLLETEIFPLCLACMDNGDSLAKEVATFILLKILMQDEGLKYCCNFAERFFSTVQVLGHVVNQIAMKKDERWLKYVLRCYVRLSESQSTIDVLKHHFPPKLRDDTFSSIVHGNPDITWLLQQLFCNMTVGLGSIVPKPKEVEIKSPKHKEVEVNSSKPIEVEPKGSKYKKVEGNGTQMIEDDGKGPKSKEDKVNGPKPKEVEPKSPKPKDVESRGPKPKDGGPKSPKSKDQTGPKNTKVKGVGPKNPKPKA